jgi:serine/threonine protein phosphatase PrpC
MHTARNEGARVDQHETRTEGEGQEESRGAVEAQPSAEAREVGGERRGDAGGAVAPEGSAADESSGASATGEGDQPSAEPPEGTVQIGPYAVDRVLAEEGERRVYVAHAATEGTEGSAASRSALIIGNGSTDAQAAGQIVALQLRHLRLLAPTALVRADEKTYLTFDLPDGAEVQIAGSATPLSALDALRAGAGLADALAYLHRSSVVHQSIAPGAIFLQRNRAYLAILDHAALLPADAEDSSARFAQDVGALAQALAALAEPAPDAAAVPMSPEESLRNVIARGAAGEFQTAEELQAACGAAVQLALHGVAATPGAEETARVAYRVATATSVGRVRLQNQDAAAVATFDVVDDVAGEMPVGVFLVADGMGGEARGELASRIGARVVLGEMTRYFMLPAVTEVVATPLGSEDTDGAREGSELLQMLGSAVVAANEHVRALAETLGEATGSTITAVAVCGVRAAVAHLGDSRAYLLHGDTMVRMTEDHSLLARLEAMDHPLLHDPAFVVPRNFLYRSLGQEDEAPPDLLEFGLQPGDRLLICSDGLWDEVDDQNIAQILALSHDPTTCAEALVRLANEGGGHDNSTAVVVFVQEVPPDSAISMGRIELQDIEPEAELELTSAEGEDDEDGQEADAATSADGEEA